MMKPSASLVLFSFQLQSLLSLVALAASINISSPTSSSAAAATTTAQNNQQDLNFINDNQPTSDFGRTRLSRQLFVQPSIEISANDSNNNYQLHNPNSNPNHSQNQNQNSRFRVNVSNVCEKNHMKITVRLSRPFYGLIHAKEKRKKVPCFVEGNGDQSYTLDMSFTLLPTDAAYCGMAAHHLSSGSSSSTWTRQPVAAQQQQTEMANQSMLHGSQQQQQQQETLSLALVVRLHKTIEFSDDRYFLLSCPNRCSRSDCSSTSVFNAQDSFAAAAAATTTTTHERKGFIASDSISMPVFRSSAAEQQQQQQQRVSSPNQQRQLIATTSERCDMMIDLKFQWLVKLCWILIGLIALMFCTIFYLCVSSDASSSSASLARTSRKPRSDHESDKRRQVPSTTSSGKTQSNDQPKSWSSLAADTTESLATTTEFSSCKTMTEQQQMNELRHSNQYLANKQHLLLADFLAAESAFRHDHERQPRVVVGRSEDDNTFACWPHRQIEGRNILRRRSIGGSAAILSDCTETPPSARHQQQQKSDQMGPPGRGRKEQLGSNNEHKLKKSKSQTTIYYEQSQDPFRAIAFNVGGGAYLPGVDGHQQPRGSLSNDQTELSNQPRGYSFMDVHHDDVQRMVNSSGEFINQAGGSIWPHSEPQSGAANSFVQSNELSRINRLQSHNHNQHNQQQQQQIWQQAPGSGENPPQTQMMSLVGAHGFQHNQLGTSSQFDPQNHSRQLIDLIQHKHREQMAQAAGITHNQINVSTNNNKPVPRPILTTGNNRQHPNYAASRTEQQQQWSS